MQNAIENGVFFRNFTYRGNKKPHLHRTLLQISAGGAGTAFTESKRGTFLREAQAFSEVSSSGRGSSEVQLGHLTASIAMVLLQ